MKATATTKEQFVDPVCGMTVAPGRAAGTSDDFNEIYRGARNTEVARSLNPELESFSEWLDRNKSRIPLV